MRETVKPAPPHPRKPVPPHPRKPVRRRRSNGDDWVDRVRAVLQNTLGDLYGGRQPDSVSAAGHLDWKRIGERADASVGAKTLQRAAERDLPGLVGEIKDYLESHLSTAAEKWLAEGIVKLTKTRLIDAAPR